MTELTPSPRFPGKTRDIYIIPISGENWKYEALYPPDFKQFCYEPHYYKTLRINYFQPLAQGTLGGFKECLFALLEGGLVRQKRNLFNRLILGFGLIAFGFFDFVTPDPIMLLDEFLIIAGGCFCLKNGFDIKKVYPAHRQNMGKLKKAIAGIPSRESPLCSEIYKAISSRNRDYREFMESIKETAPDSFPDHEADLYSAYLDPERLINSLHFEPEQIKNVMNGIGTLLPLDELERLHRQMESLRGKKLHKRVNRIRAIREQITAALGFTTDAISVYGAFYKSAADYFKSTIENL